MTSFKTAIKIFIFMTILTGVIYPLFMTAIAQLTMTKLANGSLIQEGDKTIGSALIAQKMTQDGYFWPRPSAIDYDPIKPSSGSNLGPTSQTLKDAVEKRKKELGHDAPPELLYSSGSGLDPHINFETADFQIPRVAKARSIDEKQLKNLILELSEGNQLGFLGPRYVNVLLLNRALDEHQW